MGQGKVFRERGWWLSGQDKLVSYSTKLEGWAAIGQTLDAKLFSALTGALKWHRNGITGSPLLCSVIMTSTPQTGH